MFITEVAKIVFFIMARNKLLLSTCNHHLARKKSALIYIDSGGIETLVTK